MISATANADTCRSVTVLESLNLTGGVGKHFRFSAEEFSDMVGYDKWEFEEFEVVQSGSQSWEGTIQVRKDKNTSYGWKFYEASDGDWKVNDTITLKNCSNPVRNPCKDVTFGGCDLIKSKVLRKISLQTVQLCNEECDNTYKCTTYRFIDQTKECILTTNEKGDYRADCNIIAGPTDMVPSDCLMQIGNQICDFHLEEDCDYNGELLMKPSQGDVGDANTCQEFCKVRSRYCKYWIYHKREDLCILNRDGRRTCTAREGPKEPSYDQCKHLTKSRYAL